MDTKLDNEEIDDYSDYITHTSVGNNVMSLIMQT